MTQRDIRIRPLSEGIGLGALKSPTPRVQITDIDTSVMRQAHAAYAPNSVEAEIRQRLANRWYAKSMRFLSETGLDVFVGVISAFMVAWISVLAWSAGETGGFDVLGSLVVVTNFLTAQPLLLGVAEVVLIALLIRFVRYLAERFT